MKPTASYLQHNLNGEHCCKDDVSVGQDLREQCKMGGLSSFFYPFFISNCQMCCRRPGPYLVPVGLGIDGVLGCQGDGGQQNKEQD